MPSTRAAARPTPVTSSGVSSRLATPRMPSVPKRRLMTRWQGRDGARRSPLRVLRCLARLLQSVLAALLLTRVTREQARLLERRPHLLVERDECTGDAEAQRAGLTTHTAAVDAGIDVVDVGRLRDPQRLGGRLT